MLSVFMVAEKPSICTSVAQALAGTHVTSRNKSPPVYEFSGTFLGQPAMIKVTSVIGHLYSLDFPGKYQNWDSIDPMELFDAPTVHVSEGKGGIVKHLEREAKGQEVLVLWMDCDREGENICFEVMRTISSFMKKNPRLKQTVYRAKFSAVTKKDIDKAMASLVFPNENEAKAVDARQELDLKVGVAFSRFQTRYFQGKYGDLDSSVISYGPCQTPTLGFVVQRFDEIQTFVPENYWTLQTSIVVDSKSSPLPVLWTRKRLFDQNIVDMFAHLLRAYSHLQCTHIQKSQAKRLRPQGLNTVNLLKIASKNLGISPHAAMRAAESLYLQGYISYPRTETTAYPPSFDILEVLRSQRGHPVWGEYTNKLLRTGHTSPRAGYDAGDHPPITPVGLAVEEGGKGGSGNGGGVVVVSSLGEDSIGRRGVIGGDMWRIYELVCKHFLASISPDARYEVTTARFKAAGVGGGTVAGVGKGKGIKAGADGSLGLEGIPPEEFVVKGKRETDPGFLVLYSRGEDAGDEEEGDGEGGAGDECEGDDTYTPLDLLPALAVNALYSIHSVHVKPGHTSPPPHMTEHELISLMEKHGIGTDASIPTHINNIVLRNYVVLGAQRTLTPTDLGGALVRGYVGIDPDLVLPEVRGAIERYCSLIAKGEASLADVVQHSLVMFKNKFLYFTEHITHMDKLMEVKFSPLSKSGKPLCKCGVCGRYMLYLPLPPARLFCPTCNELYPLPPRGTIKLYKELKCPLDQFELVYYSLGNGGGGGGEGKGYPLCPYCYSHPPKFKEIEDEGAGDNDGVGGEEGDDGDGEEDGEEGDESDDDELEGGGHMGCNACLYPSCQHSAFRNGVGVCVSGTQVVANEGAGVGKEVASGGGRGRGGRSGRGSGRDGGAGRGGRGGGRDGGRGGGRGGKAGGTNFTPMIAASTATTSAPHTFTCDGLMVLDSNSKPNWKLGCNECSTLLRFKADIHNITVLYRQTCPSCSKYKLLEIEFHKVKTPLKNGETKYVGCVGCDTWLKGITENVVGRTIALEVLRKQQARRRLMALKAGKKVRGRGRGGKRGGRGKQRDKSAVLMSFEDF